MQKSAIVGFQLTRFEFERNRLIGDAQVSTSRANVAALEIIDEQGRTGLGFIQSLFQALPCESEIARIFSTEAFPRLEGRLPASLALEVTRARGGNVRSFTLPFEEAIQHAVWDLFAKSADLPLSQLLGQKRERVPVYASGLDFHLPDHEFSELFGEAAEAGYRGFKIKVGHEHIERDVHRLNLLRKAIGGGDRPVMIDANEAWSAAEASCALDSFASAGHKIFWLEDPLPRDDFAGLNRLRQGHPVVRINSGEYLDIKGKRKLLEMDVCDMLNVHGHVGDVMRAGWLANEHNVEVTFGNSFLEIGVNMALALPGVRWLEYSFQNFDHIVERPFEIRDGLISGSDAPGHGLVLSEAARSHHRVPEPALEAAQAATAVPLR